MKKYNVHKSKWFWPWQDNQEETWLEEMSRQGFHLKEVQIWGGYDFIEGTPKDYIYRLDFRDSLKQKEKEAYLHLFTDLGWEHMGEMNGWQYFRREAQPDAARELFTDADSKIQKYKRILTWVGLSYPSYLVIFVALWGEYPEWAMWLTISVIILTSIIWLWMFVKLWQRIDQLKAL